MAGKKILGSLLTDIQSTLKGVADHAEDLRLLAGRTAALQRLHDELVRLNREQLAAQAHAQELTAAINAQSKAARNELALLRKGVQAVYGDNVRKLKAFGIRVKS